MINPKFNIGDTVWMAKTDTRPVYKQCLECMGKRFLTVILGDDSHVTIECECCRRGYLGAQGQHEYYEHFEAVLQMVISGVESSDSTFEYRLRIADFSCYIVKESDVFSTEEEAKNRADYLSIERTESQKNSVRCKANNQRSWTWHVKYHRDAIRRAQESIAQHSSQLEYAKTVSKKEVSE